MDALDASCRISITCLVNSSEDVQKIRHALSNVFPEIEFELKNNVMYLDSSNLQCMEKLQKDIKNKQLQKALGRQLRKNTRNNSLWFYLNKQAAFANVTALCENEDESPLGPIKISIHSDQIDGVAQWLIQA